MITNRIINTWDYGLGLKESIIISIVWALGVLAINPSKTITIILFKVFNQTTNHWVMNPNAYMCVCSNSGVIYPRW